MTHTTRTRAAVITTAMLLPLFTALPASANDDDVIREGGCSGGTDWKVKASPEDGRVEVEGEIDSNRSGQTWHWKIEHNGSSSARGSAVTGGRSGSFEVRRVLVDLSGADTFVFRARNRGSGEICRGFVTF